MGKSYPSNLTRAEYEFLSGLIPEAKPGGRPRSIEMWAVLNAIFYVLVEGCRWRASPLYSNREKMVVKDKLSHL